VQFRKKKNLEFIYVIKFSQIDQESVFKWDHSHEIKTISSNFIFISPIQAIKNNDERALFILYA
jgi:hypothetical protein